MGKLLLHQTRACRASHFVERAACGPLNLGCASPSVIPTKGAASGAPYEIKLNSRSNNFDSRSKKQFITTDDARSRCAFLGQRIDNGIDNSGHAQTAANRNAQNVGDRAFAPIAGPVQHAQLPAFWVA